MPESHLVRRQEDVAWTCCSTAISKSGKYVATVSNDAERTRYRLRMWAISGELRYERLGFWESGPNIMPVFSDDENFLAFCVNNSIDILDTESLKLVNKCKIDTERGHVMAVSIAANAKRIAIGIIDTTWNHPELPAEHSLEPLATQLRRIADHMKTTSEKFPKSNPDNPHRSIDVISTSRAVQDLGITYMGGARYLFITASLGLSQDWSFLACWDTLHGRFTAYQFGISPGPTYTKVPLRSVNIGSSSAVVYSWGDLVTVGDHVKSYYSIKDTTMIHGVSHLDGGSLALIEFDGSIQRVNPQRLGWITLRASLPLSPGEAFLSRWAPRPPQPMCIDAVLYRDDLPLDLNSIKGFATTTNGLTLLLEDETFIHIPSARLKEVRGAEYSEIQPLPSEVENDQGNKMMLD